jgi:hypothetical protein
LTSTGVSGVGFSDGMPPGTDLRGANLRGAQLSGANLTGVCLRGANLGNANLRDASLAFGTDLRGVNLSGADLSRADLGDARLSGARLSHAHLIRADLSRADLSSADLDGADLRGADLRGVLGVLISGIRKVPATDEKTVRPATRRPGPNKAHVAEVDEPGDRDPSAICSTVQPADAATARAEAAMGESGCGRRATSREWLGG